MKKRRGSSARGARALKNEKGMKPKKINFSDIPNPWQNENEKEHLRQQERAGMIRKTDDDKA